MNAGKAPGDLVWFDSPRFPRRQRSYWIGSITFHLYQGNKGVPQRGAKAGALYHKHSRNSVASKQTASSRLAAFHRLIRCAVCMPLHKHFLCTHHVVVCISTHFACVYVHLYLACVLARLWTPRLTNQSCVRSRTQAAAAAAGMWRHALNTELPLCLRPRGVDNEVKRGLN